MNIPKVILVDEKDRKIGFAEVKKAHLGAGKHHRAFVTLLFDSKNKVLLQRRRHKLFDGMWDLTAISHPLSVNGKTETYQEASDRALYKEMGISHVPVKKVGAFNYVARDGKNAENEYCAILSGNFDGKFKANPKEVYETRRITLEEFLTEVERKNYTPWAKEAARILLKSSKKELFDEMSNFFRRFVPYAELFFRNKRRELSKYPKLIPDFYNLLEDFGKGGKVIRPFLVYLGYKLNGGRDLKVILPICLAVELVHNCFLIQDDIIDESEVRRGKRTIYTKLADDKNYHYGISQAIMIADIALFEAYGLVGESSFEERSKKAIFKRLSEVFLETVYGESLDVEYAYEKPKLDAIWQMTQLKTAKYTFVGPLTIGALAAQAKPVTLERIAKYGLLLGTLFQIKDDELGVFGDENVTGKSSLSDMREGKNTVLFYKTFSLCSNTQKKRLSTLWGKRDATYRELDDVKRIIIASGALEELESEMILLVKKCKKQLEFLTKVKNYRLILDQFVDYVWQRQN